MTKTILVTGGAGFLGINLCKRLLGHGYRVIAVDNLSAADVNNLKELKLNPQFKFIKHDIVEPLDLKVDAIFNLACPASPPRYQADPIQTTKTSVIGSINMLELARKHNIPILHTSTSEVYGDPEVHPQLESYRGNVNPIGIRACYDEGKRCAESLFFDYKRMYDVDIKIVRIFNTYGPYMDPYDGRVVSNFIVKALLGEPLEVYGDGSQTRSFCYADDMIDALIAMLDSNIAGPINIGNPGEFTILELTNKVIEMTGSKSQIIYKDLPADDPMRRRPDITLAGRYLDWKPKIDLDKGLIKTIEYFREVIARRGSISSHSDIESKVIGL